MPRISESPYDSDVIPQAIFWRPLRYFSHVVRRSYDELDQFYGISYDRGNRPNFDIRHYDGHPAFTASLYLPLFIRDITEIMNEVSDIVRELALPRSAIGWQRSKDGNNELAQRTGRDRLREPEARILALKIASLSPNRTASTEFIKKRVPEYIELTRSDLEPSATRSQEQLWQQIIGNVISHRHTPQGPFEQGYATRTRDGLRVTDKGMDYLKSIGFSV